MHELIVFVIAFAFLCIDRIEEFVYLFIFNQ